MQARPHARLLLRRSFLSSFLDFTNILHLPQASQRPKKKYVRRVKEVPAPPPRASAPRPRPAHEAIHAKLVEEYRLEHSKDPSGDVWYRLLETAKAQVAAETMGKRRRVHTALPDGFVPFADA